MGPPRTFFGETSGRGLNHPFAIMLYWLQSTNMGISRTAAQRAFFSVDKDLRRFAGSGHWAAWAGGRRPLFSFPHDSVRVMFKSCSKVRAARQRGGHRRGHRAKMAARDAPSRNAELRDWRRKRLKYLDSRPEMARPARGRARETLASRRPHASLAEPGRPRRQIVSMHLSLRRFVDPASPVRYRSVQTRRGNDMILGNILVHVDSKPRTAERLSLALRIASRTGRG